MRGWCEAKYSACWSTELAAFWVESIVARRGYQREKNLVFCESLLAAASAAKQAHVRTCRVAWRKNSFATSSDEEPHSGSEKNLGGQNSEILELGVFKGAEPIYEIIFVLGPIQKGGDR